MGYQYPLFKSNLDILWDIVLFLLLSNLVCNLNYLQYSIAKQSSRYMELTDAKIWISKNVSLHMLGFHRSVTDTVATRYETQI